MNAANLVQKLWRYCNVLRDDGMSYGDYVEQLTYLRFRQMADERSMIPAEIGSTSPVANYFSSVGINAGFSPLMQG